MMEPSEKDKEIMTLAHVIADEAAALKSRFGEASLGTNEEIVRAATKIRDCAARVIGECVLGDWK